MVGRAVLRLIPGGVGDMSAPVPAADRPGCRVCGAADPEPALTCLMGRDHYVGPVAGCPYCGRLREACSRLPCFGSMHEAAMTARLVRLSRLARRLVIRPAAGRADQ